MKTRQKPEGITLCVIAPLRETGINVRMITVSTEGPRLNVKTRQKPEGIILCVIAPLRETGINVRMIAISTEG